MYTFLGVYIIYLLCTCIVTRNDPAPSWGKSLTTIQTFYIYFYTYFSYSLTIRQTMSFFKKLRALSLKIVKTEHHVSNLKTYLSQGIVPMGLILKASPLTTGAKSIRFMDRWNNILHSSSVKLMDLLHAEASHKHLNLQTSYNHLYNKACQELSGPELLTINERLHDILRIESRKLHKKQVNKFKRDGVLLDTVVREQTTLTLNRTIITGKKIPESPIQEKKTRLHELYKHCSQFVFSSFVGDRN